jgi:hypothetical protein
MAIGTESTRPARPQAPRKPPLRFDRTPPNLRRDVAYLQQQVEELHSRLHGELGVLALRIEDNERRAMKRRKAARTW